MDPAWWDRPGVSWPVGFVLGLLSGLLANFVSERIRRRRRGNREYISITSTRGVTEFEGVLPASISVQTLLESLYGQKATPTPPKAKKKGKLP